MGQGVRFSGGVEGSDLLGLLFERGFFIRSGVVDQGHRLGGEVAALHEPIVSLKVVRLSRAARQRCGVRRSAAALGSWGR